MAAIDTVRNLMHGERKMCSVCEIARATGLDTEVVKPLMVQIAMEQPRKLWEAAPRTSRYKARANAYTAADEHTIRALWEAGASRQKIAYYMGRSAGSIASKTHRMQREGTLPKRYRKKGETNGTD